MEYAPIVITVYDRINHLKKCISSLQNNHLAKYSDLYIISDAPYCREHEVTINAIRQYITKIKGFKKVYPVFRQYNMGGHESILTAIQDILKKYDFFISLEDDIVVSENFLEYMNSGLAFYKNDKKVFSVCSFSPAFDLPSDYKKDIYFYPCNSPWGIATWKDRWEQINYDHFDRYNELKKDKRKYKEFLSIGFYIKGILKADSKKEIIAGDLRVYYHMFLHNMYSVFPVVSKSQNWGFDGTGEHCDNKKAWWAKPPLDKGDKPIQFEDFNGYNQELLNNHRKFQDKINGGFFAKYIKYTMFHDFYKKVKKKISL